MVRRAVGMDRPAKEETVTSHRIGQGSALVFGVGPGLGSSVVQAFRSAGLDVTAVARREASLEGLDGGHADGGSVTTVVADATDDEAVRRIVADAKSASGHLDVVVYNAAVVRPDEPGELSAIEHMERLDINALGALRVANAVLSSRHLGRRTTVLMTGGMPEPKAPYTSLSVGKAALRTVVRVLDEAHSSELVRIGMVTPDGPIRPGTTLDPEVIAQEYVAFHSAATQPWRIERILA